MILSNRESLISYLSFWLVLQTHKPVMLIPLLNVFKQFAWAGNVPVGGHTCFNVDFSLLDCCMVVNSPYKRSGEFAILLIFDLLEAIVDSVQSITKAF